VHVRQTAIDDLKGVARVARRFLSGRGRLDLGTTAREPLADDMGRQLVSFAAVGAVSTALSVVLFLLLRGSLGALAANAVALTATVVANTWANRRYTFSTRGRNDRRRHYLGALALFVAGLALSTLMLGVARLVGGGSAVEGTALAVSWTATTVARFAVLRSLVFRRRGAPA